MTVDVVQKIEKLSDKTPTLADQVKFQEFKARAEAKPLRLR
jgi:hypothetical protein